MPFFFFCCCFIPHSPYGSQSWLELGAVQVPSLSFPYPELRDTTRDAGRLCNDMGSSEMGGRFLMHTFFGPNNSVWSWKNDFVYILRSQNIIYIKSTIKLYLIMLFFFHFKWIACSEAEKDSQNKSSFHLPCVPRKAWVAWCSRERPIVEVRGQIRFYETNEINNIFTVSFFL